MSIQFSKKIIAVVLTLALISLTGCFLKRHTEPPPPPPPSYLVHEVKYLGETLGIISLWYTGESSNYEQILAANPGLNERKITIGTMINIPEALVVRREPLPRKAITKTGGRGTPSKSKPVVSGSAGEDVVVGAGGSVPALQQPSESTKADEDDDSPTQPFGDVPLSPQKEPQQVLPPHNGAEVPKTGGPLLYKSRVDGAAPAVEHHAEVHRGLDVSEGGNSLLVSPPTQQKLVPPPSAEQPLIEPPPAEQPVVAVAPVQQPAIGGQAAGMPGTIKRQDELPPAPTPEEETPAAVKKRSILEEMLDGK